MGFFSKLVKAGIDTVSLPVAIIKDVATLGGAIFGNERTYTGKKLEDIGEDIEEAKDEL
jgi:hypothetical protein